MTSGGLDGEVRERSGWRLPIMVALAVVIVSGAVLAWYLRPTSVEVMGRAPVPTAAAETVTVTVGGVAFAAPANYLAFARARQGGTQSEVVFQALLPSFAPFTEADAAEFRSNAPDARVVTIQVRAKQTPITEALRLERIYMAAVAGREGTEGPAGLRQYAFAPATGYEQEDLFVARIGEAPLVFRCGKERAEDASPSCLRETEIEGNLALSYRFKRAHLAEWQAITDGVTALVGRFRQ